MEYGLQNKSSARKNVVAYSLFSAWMLAFVFEGQVLSSLAEKAGIDGSVMALPSILAQFLGLFCSGFFIKGFAAAKITMIASSAVFIAGSLIFFLPFSGLWYLSLIALAFFAGIYVASWGFFFKAYAPPEQRLKTAAEVLILSNVLMILINVIAVNYSAYGGLILSLAALISSLFLFSRLEASALTKTDKTPISSALTDEFSVISKPMIFLCLFIFVITINSGFMYRVVNPAFAHHQLLASYYWAVPYILALLVLRNLPAKLNQAYILYVAMSMIGVAYIFFMLLDKSAVSYLLVDTLMLGAFGVCDLFWWSILGSMLEYTDNPAQVFGIGLSMNVLGILCGNFIGGSLMANGGNYLHVSVIALAIIFAVIIILPVLNIQLTKLLQQHAFLVQFAAKTQTAKDNKDNIMLQIDSKRLTAKEIEVIRLILKGYTYKAIAENLFITENTMKYHIKNIYQKLNINSKMELIKIFANEQDLKA